MAGRGDTLAGNLLAALVGHALRQLRESRGLTQRQVESITGIHAPVVNRLEHGHHMPELEMIAAYTYPLGSSPAEVLGVVDVVQPILFEGVE